MTIKTYNMKTKYLIPQTEAIAIQGFSAQAGLRVPRQKDWRRSPSNGCPACDKR